jgi:cytochrome P450
VTDWVPLASLLPVRLAALLLGLPDDNVDQLRFWSDALERAISVQDADELKAAGEDFAPIYDYIRSFFQEKQASSSDDLIATLLRAELDNERLSEDNILMFAVTMLAAGNDTTRSLLSGLVVTLAQHPEELAKVVADRSLLAGTIEECMRWITPARGFVRWVRHDTEIRGTKLRQGQYVYILYAAANRDEEMFEHAETFDVARKENAMQLAFGFGTHVCIGAPLVRLEAKALLSTLLDTFEHFELAGAPSRVQGSALREGWTHAPVIFS